LILLLSHTSSNQLRYSFSLWFYAAHSFLYALPMFVLAVWALGRQRRKRLLEWARLRSMRILGFAVLLPIAAFWLPHVIAYAIDRIEWAQRLSGSHEAPLPILYLHIPPMGPHLIIYVLTAILSEWCWRGCMQPQFIRSFGLVRGIFLVGILYGSAQQLLFPVVLGGVPDFFLHLGLQLIWGVVWSTILGWLTLSAASVWPAVVCASMISVLTHAAMSDGQEIIPRQFLRLSLLGSGCAIAFILVHYLPFPKYVVTAGNSIAQTS
jgi:hypothetical protein